MRLFFGLLLLGTMFVGPVECTSPSLGRYQEIDLETADFQTTSMVKKATDFALEEINAEATDSSIATEDQKIQNPNNLDPEYPITLHSIVKAESQVVAGTNYRIQFTACDSNQEKFEYEVVVFDPLPYTGDPMQLKYAKLLNKVSSNCQS